MERGEDEEEDMLGSEDEASFSGSSSSSDDDEEMEGEESPGARERALAEARAMLRDKKGGKGRGKFFEDEVSHCPCSVLVCLLARSLACLLVSS